MFGRYHATMLVHAGQLNFINVLTPDERRRLIDYREKRNRRFGQPRKSDVFCLGENAQRLRWSCVGGSIPTLTKQWKKMWFDQAGR